VEVACYLSIIQLGLTPNFFNTKSIQTARSLFGGNHAQIMDCVELQAGGTGFNSLFPNEPSCQLAVPFMYLL